MHDGTLSKYSGLSPNPEKQTKAETVYHALRQQILTLKLPGCGSFGCGRQTARAGLLRNVLLLMPGW